MPRRKLTEEEKAVRKQKMEAKKVAQKIEREKQLQKERLERRLQELKEQPLSTPRYFFKKGENALPKSAHWKDMKILEVLEDGKIYLVQYTRTNNNYGNPIEYSHTTYLPWMDLVRVDEVKAPEVFNNRKNRLKMSFHNTPLSSLFSKYYSFKTDMSPEYQRGLVWDQEDKEKLIDSIFQGIEIGKFAFIKLPFKVNEPAYEILDGKQRMSTIIEFYEDKFTYKGYYFSQLHPGDIFNFLDYNITVGETEDLTDKQKYDYFLKLNTTGKPQDPEHIEKIKKLIKDSE